jgi:hypothetical protein
VSEKCTVDVNPLEVIPNGSDWLEKGKGKKKKRKLPVSKSKPFIVSPQHVSCNRSFQKIRLFPKEQLRE